MRNELKNIEIIEKYLNNKLSTEEKNTLENNMNIDSNFYEEVMLQKTIQKRIQLSAFKENLEEFSNQVGDIETVNSSGISLFKIGLAVLALLFSIGLFFQFNKKQEHSFANNKITLVEIDSLFEKTETVDTVSKLMRNTETKHQQTTQVQKPKKKNNFTNKKQLVKTNRIPNKLKVPFQTVFIDIDKGDTIIMNKSQSKIYILANSMIDKDGVEINGKVKIKYREYRDVSDIAFSEIPMTYSENGQDYRFDSGGMFEIRAFQNGKELKLKKDKPMQTDFMLTERMEDLNFYALNDETQEWSYLNDIKLATLESIEPNFLDTCVLINNLPMYKNGFEKYNEFVINHPLYLAAKKYGLKGVSDFILEIDTFGNVENVIISEQSDSRLVDTIATLMFKDLKGFKAGIIENKKVKMPISTSLKFTIYSSKDYLKTITHNSRKKENRISKKQKNGFKEQMGSLQKIVAEYISSDTSEFKMYFGNKKYYEVSLNGIKYSKVLKLESVLNSKDTICLSSDVKKPYFSDKNIQFYQNLVLGIGIPSFGVYNCDKMVSYNKRATIKTHYVNEHNERINPSYVTLIDLKLKAAFNSSNTSLTCETDGKNVLLLVDNEKKIYIVSKEEFKSKNVYNNGEFYFRAIEYTKSIENSKDLLKHLKF